MSADGLIPCIGRRVALRPDPPLRSHIMPPRAKFRPNLISPIYNSTALSAIQLKPHPHNRQGSAGSSDQRHSFSLRPGKACRNCHRVGIPLRKSKSGRWLCERCGPLSSPSSRAPETRPIAPVTDYNDYLLSPHWLSFRKRALDKAHHLCQSCGSRHSLQVHHLTYQRLGAELLSDVRVLCKDCHRSQHGITTP